MKAKITALVLGTCTAAVFSTAAMAGPAVGVGLSWAFGGPKPVAGPALGVKVFSTNREDRAAASVGVDYSFADRNFRPNVGVAYLGRHNVYLDANIGYSLAQQGPDFAMGTGYVNTKRRHHRP